MPTFGKLELSRKEQTMSRIGKKPVPVPDAVKVAINGRTFTAEGPKGKLELELPERTTAALEDGSVVVARESDCVL